MWFNLDLVSSFWKVPGVLLEITRGERGGGRERKNLSFDSLLIWDNLNPALMQIQGCSTTQPGPAPQPKQICGELKARMADSESEPLSFANLSSCGRWSCACGGTCLHNGHLGLLVFLTWRLQVLRKDGGRQNLLLFYSCRIPPQTDLFLKTPRSVFMK